MKSFYLIAGFVALIWAIELLNFATGHALDNLGLLPREPGGLIGIPLSPLLHGSFGHVALNTLPLIILGGFVAIEGRRRLLQLSALVIVVGGSALWMLGRSAYHIGASGLIFGYFGYLLARGWYERSVAAIAVAIDSRPVREPPVGHPAHAALRVVGGPSLRARGRRAGGSAHATRAYRRGADRRRPAGRNHLIAPRVANSRQ